MLLLPVRLAPIASSDRICAADQAVHHLFCQYEKPKCLIRDDEGSVLLVITTVLKDPDLAFPLPNNYGKENRSPKGNMWSAIPVALLCMVVNRNERKQGSGPERDKVL